MRRSEVREQEAPMARHDPRPRIDVDKEIRQGLGYAVVLVILGLLLAIAMTYVGRSL